MGGWGLSISQEGGWVGGREVGVPLVDLQNTNCPFHVLFEIYWRHIQMFQALTKRISNCFGACLFRNSRLLMFRIPKRIVRNMFFDLPWLRLSNLVDAKPKTLV